MARTNIEIDDKLVADAFRLTKFKTKKDLVNFALEELVNRLNRRKMLLLEGKIAWEGDLEQSRLDRP